MVRAVLRAPRSGQARRDVAFCLLGLPLGVPLPALAFFLTIWIVGLGRAAGQVPAATPNPHWWAILAAVAAAALLVVIPVATGAARAVGSVCRSGWRH